MHISEAAEKSGLSIDTIRFYEKSALLPPIERDPSGRRRFSPEVVDWLILLYSLRETGMPMQRMRRFASLYRKGNETIAERRQLLLDHAEALHKRRLSLDRCEEILRNKLALYQDIIGEAS